MMDYMRDHRIRIYADTSVYGALFDQDFDKATTLFFDQVRCGRFDLVLSRIVLDEMLGAPQQVRTALRHTGPMRLRWRLVKTH